MPDDIGTIRLYDPEAKIEYRAIVLILQEGERYSFCPLWKETVNKLVPIMRTDENHQYETPFDGKVEFYIDASDPFAYELWEHKSLEERINDFNKTYVQRELETVRIVKIASTADLERAGLPIYKEAGSKRVIIVAE